MSNYTKTVNFAAKDSLTTGDANKVVKGTEIDTEFNNIATAVATKYDSSSTIAVANGGTGATTAASAVSNLGALPASNPSYTGTLTGGTGVINIGSGQLGKDANGNLLVGTTSATNNASTFTVASAKSALILGSSVSADSSALLDLLKFGSTSSSSQVYVTFAYNSGANGNGTITGAGVGAAQFTANSDIRLKENIVDLSPQLANIMALRPVEFDYKLEKAHQIGFIAQEVREIYPDLIGETKDGYLTLGGLSKNDARLIKAIQELKALVDAQAVRIAALESQ
jgi:trimeric autotransporter adhesin